MSKKKARVTSNDDIQIQPGQPLRLYCFQCSRMFEITLEPRMKSGPSALVTHCPFCGSVEISED